jgi:hypothetical protein
MATFAAFMAPSSGSGGRDGTITTALVAAGSTGDIVIGFRTIFSIIADSTIHVRWGVAGTIANAAATDFLIPANMLVTMDMGEEFDRIRAFAATGATGNVYVLPLARGK